MIELGHILINNDYHYNNNENNKHKKQTKNKRINRKNL